MLLLVTCVSFTEMFSSCVFGFLGGGCPEGEEVKTEAWYPMTQPGLLCAASYAPGYGVSPVVRISVQLPFLYRS